MLCLLHQLSLRYWMFLENDCRGRDLTELLVKRQEHSAVLNCFIGDLQNMALVSWLYLSSLATLVYL